MRQAATAVSRGKEDAEEAEGVRIFEQKKTNPESFRGKGTKMNVRMKYPIGHPDGRVIPAGGMADFPANLARMLIARGQAEDPASAGAAARLEPRPTGAASPTGAGGGASRAVEGAAARLEPRPTGTASPTKPAAVP